MRCAGIIKNVVAPSTTRRVIQNTLAHTHTLRCECVKRRHMLCARSSDQCERERERGCTRKRVRVAHLTSHPFCGKASMFVSSAAAPRLSLLPIILSTLSHHPKCDSSKGLKTSPIHAVARERGEKTQCAMHYLNFITHIVVADTVGHV